MEKKKAIKDDIEHPGHYTSGEIEVWDFIKDQKLNFHLGCVVKYVCRQGKKDGNPPLKDLKKAKQYLDNWIEYEVNGGKL